MAKDETEYSMVRELSAGEQDIVACLSRAWDGFVNLPVSRPESQQAERSEFSAAIHAAQRIVLARPVIEREEERWDNN